MARLLRNKVWVVRYIFPCALPVAVLAPISERFQRADEIPEPFVGGVAAALSRQEAAGQFVC